MTREAIINYWLEKAREDIASACANRDQGLYQNAVRDTYFACFHAFTALLFKDGKSFKKHREVRAMLHRDYVRSGRIEAAWGKHYDWLFDNRQKADYRPLVNFTPDQVGDIVEKSIGFVSEMEKLLKNRETQHAL